MNLSLYKPNSKNSGCAFNFSIGPGTKGVPSLYCSAIQQYSWDSGSKTANFSKNRESPEKNINIKFNEFEVGSMISAFNNRNEYSPYHTFDENSTSIKWTPWDKSQKTKDGTQTIPAFGLVLTRNGSQTFRLPLEPGEVEALKKLFNRYFEELFNFSALKKKTAEEPKPKPKLSEEAPF